MAENRLSTLRELWKPKIVRIGGTSVAALAGYDAASNQLGFVKIGELLGMSGSLLPWWGWFLILQAIFVYALFEYVRRSQFSAPPPELLTERGVPLIADRFLMDATDRLQKLEALVRPLEPIARQVAEYQTTHRAIIDDYQRTSAQLTTLVEQVGALDKAADRARHSLHAIYIRETLMKTTVIIEESAAELYDRLAGGETYSMSDWVEWEKAHDRWEAAMRVWEQNGRFYAPDVESRIYSIDDRKYGMTWSVADNQVPGSEAMRRFKKFRIIHTQWQGVREDVERGVVQVAYVGLSEEDVRRKPPS